MIIQFEVLNGARLSDKEIIEELLASEMLINEQSRLRFHLKSDGDLKELAEKIVKDQNRIQYDYENNI